MRRWLRCTFVGTLMMVCTHHVDAMFNATQTPPFVPQTATAPSGNMQQVVWGILSQGMAGAIAQTISALMVDTLRAAAQGVYNYGSLIGSLGRRGFNHVCRRPEPFDAAHLRLFLHLVEEQLNALTEQPLSEAIIFKNMHVQQDQPGSNEVHQQWVFCVEQLDELFQYIITWMTQHLAYYQATDNQRTWLTKIAWNCSTIQRESIIFVSHMLIKHLAHIAQLSKAASSIDDIDVVHVKKVGHQALLYLKKLIQLVNGNMQDTPSIQTYTNGTNMASGLNSSVAY